MQIIIIPSSSLTTLLVLTRSSEADHYRAQFDSEPKIWWDLETLSTPMEYS
jgi:hypothetical protein